jgi:ATPase subunit of ABC transporter with duplicated ATPase domains
MKMIELSLNHLTKYYAATEIFENISFDVKTGERVGLIGQNGCGKTTILKILMGAEDYQGGEISIRKNARLGYLNQIPVYDDTVQTAEVIESAFESIYEIKKQMRLLEEQMKRLVGDTLAKALQTYGSLAEKYELSGGYEIETKINRITTGLQITDGLKAMYFNQLSGGEKTRVMLARILLEEPDVLLLDEPTNHLDLETIQWLEGFLKEYKGTVLAISHDRYFLDSIANKIIELEFSRANIYQGNYSYYTIEKERRFLIDYRNYVNQQKKIERMEQQIQRYRIWGEMRDSEKMFKKAKELEKRLEKMETLDHPVLENRKIRLSQAEAGRSGKIVLELEDVAKAFENKPLLRNVNFTVFYQDSACIIGKNGTGKTTLLKMILGELESDKGTVKTGSQVKIGYLPQNVSFEDEEMTVLDYFARLHNIPYGEARSQLAKALFLKEDVNKKISSLSGGEKSRLKLCSLTFTGINLMILDEPTNHLDIDSREVLEETLAEFGGTLLFVSHDRYFINKLASKIIVIDDCTTHVYNGDFNYYTEEYQKALANAAVIPAAEAAGSIQNGKNHRERETSREYSTMYTHSRNGGPRDTGSRDKRSRENGPSAQREKLQKNLLLAEQEIETLEETIKSLEEEMNWNSSDSSRLQELYEQKVLAEQGLKAAYEKWEAAAAELEQALA